MENYIKVPSIDQVENTRKQYLTQMSFSFCEDYSPMLTSNETLKDKSGVGMTDDAIQDNAAINSVSYFLLPSFAFSL